MQYRNLMLRDARLVRGLTQTELAKTTGLSVATINLVELGKAPWLKAIRVIAKELGVPLAELIIPEARDDDSKSPKKRKAS